MGSQSNSELAREKMWSRIYLTPMLQAEEDRDQVRRYWANKEREKALLGEESHVYHSDRYVPFLSLSLSSMDSFFFIFWMRLGLQRVVRGPSGYGETQNQSQSLGWKEGCRREGGGGRDRERI